MERDVGARLLGRQQVVDDRVDHRQEPVADAGRAIARMEQVLDAAVVVEVREARELAVRDQQPLEVGADARGERVELARAPSAAEPAERGRERVSVWTCSVTVQVLQRRSRIAGSTGWSESFQSPCP